MRLRAIFHITAFAVIISSCGQDEQQPVLPNKDTVLPIDISEIYTVLPQAGNVALIESHCMPCHSLRYIEMQPQLTYHEWEKLVDKMITVYGAPVRDSVKRRDIINYLHAIKGRQEE